MKRQRQNDTSIYIWGFEIWQLLRLWFSYWISMRYKVVCYRKDVVKLAMQHIHLLEKGCSLCILVSVSISIPIHANIHTFIPAHDSHVQLNDTTQHRMNRTNGCCSLRCVHKLLNKYNLSFSHMVAEFLGVVSQSKHRGWGGGLWCSSHEEVEVSGAYLCGDQYSVAECDTRGKMVQFSNRLHGEGCIERWTEIHKQHSALSKLFSMCVEVEGRWDGCESVSSKSELMRVQAGTDVISDMPESQFLRVLY